MAMEKGYRWTFDDYLRDPGLVPCDWNNFTAHPGKRLQELTLEQVQREVGFAVVEKISVYEGTKRDATKDLLEKIALTAQLGPVLLAMEMKKRFNEKDRDNDQLQSEKRQTKLEYEELRQNTARDTVDLDEARSTIVRYKSILGNLEVKFQSDLDDININNLFRSI